MSGCEFLLEVLCEEIPANALPSAREQLAQGFAAALADEALTGEVKTLSTVRRLAVAITGLADRAPDREVEVLGPPGKAAFSADGSPTPAAHGFARAQGVPLDSLVLLDGPKGRVVAVRKVVQGRSTSVILAEACVRVIGSLKFPKTMRWGSGDHSFVRPVHRVTALLWNGARAQVVPFELFGVQSGGTSFGHRVIAPMAIALDATPGIAAALAALEEAGVILDVRERRCRLELRASELALEAGCAIRPDPELVDELVELVEYPGLVRGAIEQRFLELPHEVLVATLRHHQKCLVLMQDDRVAPAFLAVCDRQGDEFGWVRQGNEWVAGARLTDAEFFFAQDRRRRLADRHEDLGRVVFHQRLGSFAGKVDVVRDLATAFTAQVPGTTPEAVERACLLLKCDLTTAMVAEFPELQGIMGGIYARLDGEDEAVYEAVSDQYTPAGLEGPLPRSPLAALVGVADRLDTLAALFSVGEIPTGSRDPFALRRAALGAVRICAGVPLNVDFKEMLLVASTLRGESSSDTPGGPAPIVEFMTDRIRHYLVGVERMGADVADAVLATSWSTVPDIVERARALQEVREEPVFDSLAVAFKRVRNMTAKGGAGSGEIGPLREAAERELLEALAGVEIEVSNALAGSLYPAAFRGLAALADPLDRFFVDVLVLCEDEALRESRLALLARVERLFGRLADLSRLVSSGGAH